MKRSVLFFILGAVPALAGCYDLYVGGTDGLLEAVALFILALIFSVLGSTFYLGYRLQDHHSGKAKIGSSLSWFHRQKNAS